MPDPDAARRGTDRLLAAGLGLAALGLYLATRQDGFYGDGRLFLSWIPLGRWHHWHALYMPVAQLWCRALAPLLGEDPEPAMHLLSAVPVAGAVALLFAAARRAGCGRTSAAAAALLVAVTPSVWFYATCVEVHGLHLLAASIATWTAVRAARADRLGSPALAVGLLLLLVATHAMAALVAPGLAVLALRGSGRWKLPGARVLVAVAAVGAAVLFVPFLFTRDSGGFKILLVEALGPWSWDRFVGDGVLQVGTLALGALLALRAPCFLRAEQRGLMLPLWIGLVLPLLLVVPRFPYDEHGAYYFAVLPLAAVCAAVGLDRLRPAPRHLAALLLLAPQAALAHHFLWEWHHAYPFVEWVEPLREEMGDRGLVLTLTTAERKAINRHTRIDARDLEQAEKDIGRQLSPAEALELAMAVIDLHHRRGLPVAITRSLVEHEPERARIAALVARYGAFRPGRRPEYLFIEPPGD